MELSELNLSIAEINNSIDKYNVALESVQNTNKIEEMAKTYLGMNYPTRRQTVFVDFAYGDENDKSSVVDTAGEEKNFLYAFIDKVVAFIQ
jgi:hypothetical protein